MQKWYELSAVHIRCAVLRGVLLCIAARCCLRRQLRCALLRVAVRISAECFFPLWIFIYRKKYGWPWWWRWCAVNNSIAPRSTAQRMCERHIMVSKDVIYKCICYRSKSYLLILKTTEYQLSNDVIVVSFYFVNKSCLFLKKFIAWIFARLTLGN